MKELNQLVENFFQPKRNTLGLDQLVEMVEEIINEEYYYKDSDIPLTIHQIIRYMKKAYKLSADVDYKQGVVVIEFTGVPSRKKRNEIIKDLQSKGFAFDPEYKKGTGIYDTATTNFKYKYPNGRVVDVKIRLKHGGEGGPFGSGTGYEKQVEEELEKRLAKKGYTVKVEGGATKSPDVVVTKGDRETRLETKSTLDSEFGQFSVKYDQQDNKYEFKNETIPKQYKDILDKINSIILTSQEKEIAKVILPNIGDLVEDYYKDKGVEYIIVGDRIYSTTDNPLAKAASVPRFRNSAKNGLARLREKEKEGKLMLALYVTDLDEKAPLYFDQNTLDNLFNLTNPPQ